MILTRKLILPAIIVFAALLAGIFVNTFNSLHSTYHDAQEGDLISYNAAFLAELENQKNVTLALGSSVADDPSIQEAFAARDRQRLLDLALPDYALLKAYHITQYQYHLPDGELFLSLNDLNNQENNGILSVVALANTEQKPVAGIEAENGQLGVRGVVPIFYQGKHIGSVEFGIGFSDALLSGLKERFGGEWRILLSQDLLAGTSPQHTAMGESPVPGYIVYATTQDGFVSNDHAIYLKVLNGVSGETAMNHPSSAEGKDNMVLTSPLSDFSGKTIGVLDIVYNHTTHIPPTQNQRLLFAGLISVLALVLGSLALVIFTSRTLRPIQTLTQAAASFTEDNITAFVGLKPSNDEVGTLTTAFNRMTMQLRNSITNLENRVADRTHDLELASEVGRAITEKVGNLTEMLTDAAETIRSRFDLYYTQVYLVDPSGRNLVLRAGTGDAGFQLLQRGHRLAISSASLNGRAALDRHAVIMGDTQQSSNFRSHPLLPLTRSELAIPLIVNNKVVGVLDMQNEKPETFSEANLPAFQVLAGQLAIAIQNAALFKEAGEARSVVEEQAARLTGSGWRQFLNAVDRNENIGYVFSQDEVLPWVEAESPVFDNTLTVPIEITGATVGEVQLADGTNRKWSTAETEIVQAAVSRVGQHIENLRLFGQAEKYRSEAEQVSRRLTSEGWNDYLQTRKELADGYSYNLDKVQPLNGNGHDEAVPTLSYPLMVSDEAIGEVMVATEGGRETYASEVVAAVVEQLSGHIENLRLLEQAEQRRLELETVAAVSSTVSTVLDPDKLLQTVVDMTKERFGLYHTHIYLADQNWNTLLLASGAGEVGRKMVAEEHSISMDAEKSLVARALRERQSIIANDVRSQRDFLPNPLLPETRAEMAVPMIVSDKVIGVFDVQSDNLNGFSKEDAAIYTTLASQVAIALQNARLYVEQAATVTQLRELDRLKSSFLANMSHELRTPLNSILGFTDVMLEGLDGQLTDYMDNDLRLIQKNGQHLMHLINDVLDMAKIESGKMNLNPEKFKVHDVLDEVTSITSTLASEKNLSLSIDESSDQDVEIYADNTRLRQVMINLLNNSIKFTETGKISLCVTPIAGARVLISVKDTGIGIPPDKLEAVFLEFTQVDSTTTRKVGGTGLGLPISRRLVEMHGGRVWAESTGVEGEGSTFYVELPIEARMTEVVEKQEK